MSRTTAACALMLLIMWDEARPAQAGSSLADYRWARNSFRAAEFRGIRMGSSKARDVENLFGPPVKSGIGQEGQYYMGYRGIGPIPGYVEFTIDPKTKIVEFMTLQADNWRLSDAIKIFGKRYARLRFSVRACHPDDESAYLYFDPEGDVEIAILPELGIVLNIKPLEGDQLSGATYDSAWIEPEKNPCDVNDRSKKPKNQKSSK